MSFSYGTGLVLTSDPATFNTVLSNGGVLTLTPGSNTTNTGTSQNPVLNAIIPSTPSVDYFAATMATLSGSVSASTVTGWTTETANTAFNATSGIFTATVAGVYQFDLNGTSTPLGSLGLTTNSIEIMKGVTSLLKNTVTGNLLSITVGFGVVTAGNVSISTPIKLALGDTISCRTSATTSAGNFSGLRFTGRLIGV